MRASSLMSIHTIVDNVFKQANNNLINQLVEIHTTQQNNTNSPNFFYKGEVYLLFNKLPLLPLYPPLVPTFNTYLKQLSIINGKRAALNQLLKRFTINNSLSDLFYVVPKEAFVFLDKNNFVIRTQEEIDNIYKEQVEDILLLIKEQLLHTLLL